jgi:hemerythrin
LEKAGAGGFFVRLEERMKRIEWDDSYLLGIMEIDNQHKKLLAIANDLYDTATGSTDRYVFRMSKVLKSLTDYTVYHFSEEEKCMSTYGYPSVSAHKVEHDFFVNNVHQQIKKLSSGSRDDALLFYNFVASWVLTHIAKEDRKWAAFVKPKLV